MEYGHGCLELVSDCWVSLTGTCVAEEYRRSQIWEKRLPAVLPPLPAVDQGLLRWCEVGDVTPGPRTSILRPGGRTMGQPCDRTKNVILPLALVSTVCYPLLYSSIRHSLCQEYQSHSYSLYTFLPPPSPVTLSDKDGSQGLGLLGKCPAPGPFPSPMLFLSLIHILIYYFVFCLFVCLFETVSLHSPGCT